MASHPQARSQEVTIQAPSAMVLPASPDVGKFPDARVVPEPDKSRRVVLESDTQSKTGSLYVLDGHVVITYGDRTLEADHIEYDSDTGEVTATGHLRATGGANHESLSASHGTLNVEAQTGRFYDVTGSVGMKTNGQRMVYATSNPFLFSGRMVVKTGPQEYEVYDGTVTSCQLPHPDWLLSSGKFTLDGEKARASNSVFRLLNVPLLYLPYVTHPLDTEGRQTGLLLPVVGESSTKGLILGEQLYWAINRSTDLTVGVNYFSRRGFAELATFRYRGRGDDFANAHYSGLLDRGYTPTGGTYVNQGGEDVTFAGRRDLDAGSRLVADVEYLSSYAYREAFTDNFNQAVSSDILSIAYAVRNVDGYSLSARADRYQGMKHVATLATATAAATPEQQVRIFHAPSLNVETTEHRLGTTPVLWDLDASAAGLKKVQPQFTTSGIIERYDLHPRISVPLKLGDWNFLSSVGARDTVYSRSRGTPERTGRRGSRRRM